MSASPTVVRWLARLCGLLIAGMYIFFAVGEFTTPHSGTSPTFVEGTGIALLSATCAGMLVAWRWELTGAVISLVSLMGFTSLIRVNNHITTVVLAVPGILYILDWLLQRQRTVARLMRHDRKRHSRGGTAGIERRDVTGSIPTAIVC